MESYGIQTNLWKNWTDTERFTALAFMKVQAFASAEPGPLQLSLMRAEGSKNFKGKGDYLVAHMEAQRTEQKLRAILGELDSKLIWSVTGAGSSLEETAAWLFGDKDTDIRYCARRVRDALHLLAPHLKTTPDHIREAKHKVRRAA